MSVGSNLYLIQYYNNPIVEPIYYPNKTLYYCTHSGIWCEVLIKQHVKQLKLPLEKLQRVHNIDKEFCLVDNDIEHHWIIRNIKAIGVGQVLKLKTLIRNEEEKERRWYRNKS